MGESTVFLEYGLTDANELVHVDQVDRGKTDLHCPYCGGGMLAKKGQHLAHHFVHIGDTCNIVSRVGGDVTIALPPKNRT